MVQTADKLSQDAIAQCVASVVSSRRAVRAFKPDPVCRETVEQILQEAATAPSGANIQPWRVYVVTGNVKDELAQILVAAHRAGKAPAPAHFPEPLPDLFRKRLIDFGARYYGSLGIDRNDTEARSRQTEKNFAFFGAPVGLIISIDRRLKPHSWIDIGLFAQNLMIAAKARGMDTCPQVAFAPFHAQIASYLNMPAEEVTAFGMSLGFGNPEAAVNQTKMPRERVQDFARLLGFPDRVRNPIADDAEASERSASLPHIDGDMPKQEVRIAATIEAADSKAHGVQQEPRTADQA